MKDLKKSLEIPEALGINASTLKMMKDMEAVVQKIPDYSFPKISSPEFIVPELPKMLSPEERNENQSASVFMAALAKEALQWKKELPEGHTPAIMAILYGGIQIHVENLSQISFHGIRVEGTLNGSPCSILAHQTTVQMLCYGEKIDDESSKNTIGFIWGDKNIQV